MEIRTIAFLNWQYPGGGGETVSRNLGHFFRSRGLRVVIYAGTLYNDILTDEDRNAFTLHAVPLKSTKKEGDAFCRSLKEERVDLLIVQGITSIPFEQVRREVGCKIIFCLHSIPLWEVFSARSRRSTDIPNPTFARRLEFLFLRRPVNLLTDKIKRRTLKLYAGIVPHVDRMVLLCPEYRDQMADMLRRSGFRDSNAPDEKFISLSNPLLPPEEPGTQDPKEKLVLYAGRLCYEDKRIDRLLRIWRRVERATPGWKLQILGRGDEMQSLQQLATRLGLQHVEFLGHQVDLAPFYRRASFICLTSNFEGLPMCLVEGQQYGVIPVSFDSFAAIRTITENGNAGIMVPAFSERRYADMLSAAMRDTPLQERLRAGALEASRKYDIEAIGQQWLDIFEKLRT